MESRPEIKIKLTPADKIMEGLGWCMLMLLWILTLWNYTNLPVMVPIHFNAAGQVDNYGSTGSIFIMPIIGTITFISLTIVNQHPHNFNYPTNITVENALRQYTNATRMIRYLKVFVAGTFTFIVYKMVQPETGQSAGLGAWFLPLELALIFIPTAFFLLKSLKK